MNVKTEERPLTTADLAAAAQEPAPPATASAPQAAAATDDDREGAPAVADEPLVALFTPDVANDFRTRWDVVQIGFVDDPKQAVRQADELVAQVMKSLAETFAKERTQLEAVVGDESGSASTENLRVALRRYRSFFQRLLSL